MEANQEKSYLESTENKKYIKDSNMVLELWRKTKQKSDELASRRARFFMNSKSSLKVTKSLDNNVLTSTVNSESTYDYNDNNTTVKSGHSNTDDQIHETTYQKIKKKIKKAQSLNIKTNDNISQIGTKSDIENERFGERYDSQTSVINNYQIVECTNKMLLLAAQTFVENIIKYAFTVLNHDVIIDITASKIADDAIRCALISLECELNNDIIDINNKSINTGYQETQQTNEQFQTCMHDFITIDDSDVKDTMALNKVTDDKLVHSKSNIVHSPKDALDITNVSTIMDISNLVSRLLADSGNYFYNDVTTNATTGMNTDRIRTVNTDSNTDVINEHVVMTENIEEIQQTLVGDDYCSNNLRTSHNFERNVSSSLSDHIILENQKEYASENQRSNSDNEAGNQTANSSENEAENQENTSNNEAESKTDDFHNEAKYESKDYFDNEAEYYYDSHSDYQSLENLLDVDFDTSEEKFSTPPQSLSTENLIETSSIMPEAFMSSINKMKSVKHRRSRSSTDSGTIIRTLSEPTNHKLLKRSSSEKLHRKHSIKEVLYRGSRNIRNFLRLNKTTTRGKGDNPSSVHSSENNIILHRICSEPSILNREQNTTENNNSSIITNRDHNKINITEAKLTRKARRRSISLSLKASKERNGNLFNIAGYVSTKRSRSFSCVSEYLTEYNQLRYCDIDIGESILLEQKKDHVKQKRRSQSSRKHSERDKMNQAFIPYEFNLSFEDINLRDSKGNSCLHHASSKGDIETIINLLDQGGDVWQKNRENLLPIDLAQDFQTAKLLSKATLFYNVQNRMSSEKNIISTIKLITEV